MSRLVAGILSICALVAPSVAAAAPPPATFSPVQSGPVFDDAPSGVASGDFNGDGKADVVTANLSGGNVSVLLGSGNGTFQPPVTTTVSATAYPLAVATADFDGDGKLDLATADNNSGTVSVLRGTGDGHFATPVAYPTSAQQLDIAVGDFNADGHPDIASTGNDLAVLLNDGHGAFKVDTRSLPTQISGPTAADLNGDHHLDLVVGRLATAGGLYVLLGKGDGTFGAPQAFAGGSVNRALAPGDFNADGKPDIATANYGSNDVTVFLGDGAGGLVTGGSYPLGGTYPTAIAASDLNGDGTPDVAVSDQAGAAGSSPGNVAVLLGAGDGTFVADTASPFVTADGGPSGVAAADFNADGSADLAFSWSNGPRVGLLLNSPLPVFSAPSLAFGGTPVGGTSAPKSVTISNAGSAPLTVSGVALSGARSGDFTAALGTCPQPLPRRGGACTVNVRYAPKALGPSAAALSITSNYLAASPEVSLTGTAQQPAPSPSPTPVPKPTATAGRADHITRTGAVLHGAVDTKGLAGTVAFVLDGKPRAAQVGAGGAVAVTVTGLKPGTRHTFFVRVTTSGGAAESAPASFTTKRTSKHTSLPTLALSLRKGLPGGQLLLNRTTITLFVACGDVACTATGTGVVALGRHVFGKLRAPARPLRLRSNQHGQVYLRSSLALRRAVRAYLKAHPRAKVIMTITGRFHGADGTNIRRVVRVRVRQLKR